MALVSILASLETMELVIRPLAPVVAVAYVVSVLGIPSDVISDLATAAAEDTCPVPSTVTLYNPLAAEVYVG